MKIEIIKSIGRAECRLCKEIIARDRMQVRITDSKNFSKNVHLDCILSMALSKFPRETIKEIEQLMKSILVKQTKKYGS